VLPARGWGCLRRDDGYNLRFGTSMSPQGLQARVSYQKHCPGCYAEKGGAAVCPHCGYDESATRSPLFLPHGMILGGQFRVGRVLGKPGGFGITYIGWDVHLQQRVAIKEYLPRDLATRTTESLEVRVHTDADHARFDAGREYFLHEARIVARFSHPNIVRVRSFFNANGTAYLVMDYYDGISLGEYLSTVSSRLAPGVALELIKPILRGLQYVHEHHVIHRDLKPYNIYLAAEGRPILLDFGAALLSADGRENSRAVVLTEGYAPLEQYQRRSPQGPYTDVYGAAATLYRMITGESPPMALDRLGHDPLQESEYAALPPGLRACMARALAVRSEQRYATAAEFLAALEAYREEQGVDPADTAAVFATRRGVTPSTQRQEPETTAGATEPPTASAAVSATRVVASIEQQLPTRWKWVVAALAAVVAVEFMLLLLLLR